MFFNRKGINQKNWRMIKKGKHFLFGCTLFLATGAVMIQNPHLVHADEMVASLNDSTKVKDEDPNSDKVPNDVENHPQVENHVKESDRISENVQEDKSVEKAVENTVKAVNKTALNELIEKIRNTDLQNKTVKSVENLNLSLSRAQAVLDKEGTSQDEINKEVQVLSDSFAQLEEKSNDIDKKEKQADKANDSDEKKKLLTEKIAKVQALVSEINQLAGEISYEFSESESKSLQAFGDLSEEKSTDSEVTAALNEAKSLRNKVANRVTRAHSGKRDPRNGKPIDGKGESGFRGITYTHKENRRDGKLIENGSTAIYYNSDEIWSLIEIKGERVGNERKFTTYARGKVVEDVTPYYIVTVGFTENSPIKGLKMQVAYWDKKAGVQRVREIEYGRTEINNPITNAAIRGVVGQGGIVQPGRYEVHIASNTRVAPNQLRPYTFTFIIKPQSERNTVKDLSQTYVDDVRHLTENEKTALIEKFKTEHPDVMKPSGHKSDFERAEISADGTTMTIHFKDGFNPKTIQTNATNDVEAKHSSLTAYFGDSKELYTNPRELVRSKTGHEVPTTAQVTYKTPFNLQQAGTRNVVVTTTYQNGVSKDVTTPYTVLDFIGKQDKKIDQNQSGQLGDARNYVTVSNNSAIPGELTVRWKGGSSNVDTSAAGIQHKEIEILRGNHLMKTVNIPVEIVDNINPTITAPDTVTLTRAEGLPSNISVDAQDNARGIGLKDANPIVVENLVNPLRYNPSTKRIELSGVIPNQLQSFQATVKAVDKKGNTATKAIRFNVQAQTDKYTAVANPQTQTVSYRAEPSAGASVSTTGLPSGTTYAWKTKPDTSSPGNKSGVVEVTYPDTSKDTVNVTVAVRKLSDEYVPTGTKIVRNQNVPVTNNDLKSAVSVNNNGNSKVKSVTASPISTVNAGTQTIKATVTYLDNTTDPVDIPLEVKDVTAPTIQTPNDRQNWDLIALDRTLPSIKVTSVDNNGGTGVKSTTVTGLPDFLVYDNETKTIKFKNGVQEVTKLPVGQDSKTYSGTIQVTDNSNNSSQRQVTITVKSMTTKYTATPNSQKQTVSYGEAPDAGTSVNKNGLPTGTAYTWATTPSTTTGPGDKSGVVTVTYPDGSKDTVNVKVAVRKLSDEYAPTGNTIVRNQNVPVSNDDLKTAVTISNNGNSKVKSVTPVGTITTVNAGTQIIRATVTYLDNTTDPVDIPLEVKDVTAPTIQTPTEGQLWEVTSLDKTFPSIKIAVADNPGGSGVKSVVPMNLPSFLKYDKTTSSIVFQDGVHEVPKLSGISRTTRNVTFVVEDNAGNRSERNIQIRQISMAEKYNPQANTTVQELSHGETPNPKTSVNTQGLPGDTRYAWKTTPDTSMPGDKTGVVKVTYPDDSVDEVTATVKVRKLSDEYNVTGNEIVVNQNTPVTNDDLKAKVTATSKVGNVSGTDKISTVTTPTINTANYGDQNIAATVTFKDGTTKEVTIPLKVKDVTKPTIQSPTNGQNWDLIAVEGSNPDISVTSEDNTGGSGVKTTTVTGLPDFLEYNESTRKIQFKAGVTGVPSLPEGTDVQPHNVTITVVDNAGNETTTNVAITVKSMTTKYDANPNPDKQTVSYGATPDAGTSVNQTGLPEGTSYAWKTRPSTTEGSGDKAGVVTVTYSDGSKDTVNVKVTVKELSSEYEVTGTPIEVNQNTPVTNDDLKAKVTATSKVGNVSGTDKISTVTTPTINTANYGDQNIAATVTFKDGTTKEVTIPLKVKDVTKPTISAPAENTNWEMTALDKALPNMEVRAEDNANGSGIKNVSVTGLPDYLEYDSTNNTIKFKSGKDAVEKLPENTPSREFTLNIRAEDNVGNFSEKTARITVSSMSAKNTPTPIPQNTSYGQVPDPNASVDKAGLPDGTKVTWKTPPVVNIPGATIGEVEITYPDGSKDVVTVNVTVRKVSEDFTATGTQIEVNQNISVTPEMLKGAVTATNAQGENGNAKIATVEAKTPINTESYGDQTIQAKVTYIDGSEQDVTIPLKVKDVTDPTIQTPANGQNWEMTALDKTLPPMKIEAKDNANGSGITTIEVRNMPSFLMFDQASGTIVFKEGVREVPKIDSDSDNIMHGVTIVARDKAGNSTSVLVNITVWSMRGKYAPQPKPQTVDNGTVPNAEDSVAKTGLPEGTRVTWKETPVVNIPGSHPSVALVTYPDGTVDEVTVPITVKEQKDTFNPTAKEPALTAKHGSDPSAEGSINTDGLPSGTTYKWVEKPDTNTTPGSKPGKVLITYPDKSTEEVTVTVEVTPQKDDYDPQPKAQTVDNGTVPKAEDSVAKSGLPEGTRVTWKETPVVNTPGDHPSVALVTYPDGTVDEVTVPITVKEQKETFNPTAKQPAPTAKHGSDPSAEGSINTDGLPSGTTYKWVEKPDTNTTPGSKPGKVLITYPDKSTEEVTVTVEVTPQKDDYDPQPKAQTVDNGTVPNAEDSVAKTGLPEGTRVTWKETPVVNIPGSHPSVALVTYPDGTVDEVTVPITVKEQKDTFNPTAKEPAPTAKHGSDPSAEGSINTDGLPSGTTYKWVEKPDTNTTPGSKSGKVLITYPDKSTEEVTVTVEVTPQKDDYDPQPKAQTVDNGHVPDPETSVTKTGLPEGTRVTWKDTPVVNTPGDHPSVALVTYPDGTVDEVTVPITVKEQKETFNPTAKEPAPTAKHGSDPSAEGSINTDGLPSGTTYKWVEKPDTNTTPGSKPGKVLITYPDKSTEEVPVTVEVTPQKDDYDPQPKAQTVDNGHVPDPETSVTKTGLPEGTRVTWKDTPVVNTPGDHPSVALVTYPDGTVDEVTVPITVKEQKETFNPTAKEPAPTAKHGSDPSAEGSINTDGLPSGTTYKWVEKPDTNTTPGSKPGKVLITYPDKSTEEVTVTVEVTPQKDDYDPQPKAQTVDNGHVLDPETSVTKTGLPEGTRVTWKDTPVVNTPGDHPSVALVTYPDGTVDEVTVPITVKEQKETFNPTAKEPAPTAKHGSDPSAEGSINTDGLPSGTTYKWVEKPDTNTTPGSKPGKVLITYPDKSTEEVTVTVEVTPQKDDYDPQPKAQTVDNGHVPDPETSVTKTGLPEGTRVTWKDTPVVNTPGDHPSVALVTYPDGTVDEVTVPITVKEQKETFNPTAKEPAPTAKHGSDPSAEGSINTDGLPSGTTYKWVEKPDTNTTPGSKPGKVLITYPDHSTEEVTVTVEVTPQKDDYDPQPKAKTVDNGHVPDPETSVTKTGLPEGTRVTWKETPVVNTPGSHPSVALVTYPDGTVDEVTVPITVKEQKDTFNPTAKEPAPTAKHGSDPSAEGSINTDGLPSGTTYKWVEKPDTNTTPGSKPGKVLITYPDKSTEEVTVTVEVTPQKDDYDPQPKAQTVDNGTVPNAEDSVDKTGLPEGTRITWKETPVVNTPGSHPSVALVTYPDGTVDEVTVPVTVKEQKETFNPTAKEPALTAKHGSDPSAEGSINTDGLPSGTTYKWVEKPDTNTTPGSKPGKVLITYPDNSTEEVTVTVEVTPQKDDYDPQPKAQTVDNGHVLDPETSVTKTGLPEGTRVTWKDTPVVNTPGDHPSVALVTYPDGTVDEVTVPITVKEQKETFNPTAKEPAPTAKHGSDPSAEGSINTDGLPSGTTYKWVEKPDTNTTPGSKPGKVLITYPDHSTEEVTVTVEVTPQKDDYDPQPKAKTVDNGHVPDPETSVTKTGLPEGTRVTWKDTPVVNTPGSHPSVALVTYPDGTVDEVTVPITVKEQKETFNPTAKEPAPTAKHGSDPSAEGSINTDGLPSGTTYKWVEKPDTNTTPGSKPGKVLITYPDHSTEEVTVTVEVTPQKDDYDPQPKAKTVDNGHVPDPETSVTKTGLPEGTRVTWKETPVVNTPGSHPSVALVTYPDGTVDEVTVPITVKEQKDTFNPTAKEPAPTAKHGSDPSAEGSINTDGLPSGTTYKWVEKPDTNTTPGSKPGKVLITYPDKSTEEVTVTVEVTPQKDDYDPQPKAQTVDNGTVPNAEDSVDKTGLPEGTRITWKETPVVNTPGSHPSVALVTYPDGTVDEVTVPVTVKEQKETFNPTAKEPALTAKHGSDPSAEGSINTDGLPSGTTYKWVEKPDTNTTPGSKPGKVLITYPDNSTEEVTVTVEVTPQKDDYDPQPKAQTVDNGTVPNAEDSVDKTGLPSGTTIAWKETPVVNTPGSHPSVALVTYPDGTVDEVTVPITVKEQKETFNPTAKEPAPTAKHGSDPSAEGSINTDGLPSGTTYKWVEKPDTNTTPGSKPGKVLITYPDKSTEEVTVTVEVTPQKDDYDPQPKAQTVDNGHVLDPETSVTKTGLPEGTRVTWKDTPVVNTPGDHPSVALVTYPDGTVDEVTVPITVKEQKETFNPTAKEPAPTAKHGSDPSAEGSINTDGLPSGTTYKWVEKPDTNTTPGSKPGKVLITYPDKSTEEVTVTVEVTPQKDDYDPQPKAQTVDNGHVPDPETSVTKTGLPEGTRVTWKDTPVVNTPGDHPSVALVTYPDGTVDEVTVPITVKEQKETFNPTAKEPAPTAKHGSDPSAEGSINTDGLPSGTTYKWVEKPDTNTTPGSKPGKVLITYPDHSTEEVTVTVEVTPQKDDYDPQPKAKTVDNGHVPDPETSVTKTGLPEGTRVTWKETPVVNTPGSHPSVALVTYPDGTVDEVTVPITVKEQKDTFNPTAKEPAPTAKHGSDPSAEGSINTDGLPSGTTYKWVEKPDTNTTPGSKPGKVLITYPDKSTEEVTVTVEVTPQKDDYDPQPKAQTVDNGTVPNAEDSVDKTGLPEGTRITWKETPVVNTPGSHPSVALVTYPDGTVDEVTVPITVKEQKDTFNPTAKEPAPTAKHGSDPSAEGSINTDGLPSGTTYKWVEKPDTNTTPGSKPGKVLITYPDNSTEEVTVTVEVTPQKDDYDPQPKAQTVDNGHVPDPETSVTKNGLPEGTRVTWKDTPVVNTPGDHPSVALVTYPDGTVDEVTVPITVKEQKETFNPTAKEPAPTAKHGSDPSAEGSINTDGLPKGTTYTWVEKPDTNTTPGSKPGKVLITYPDHSTEEVSVTVEVTPQKDDYDPQPKAQTVDNGHVPDPETSVTKTGLPEGTRVTWKDTPVVNTPGDHPSVALVTYPDGTVDEVTVPITVKEQKETFNPTAKEPAPTAKHGSDPSAEGSINTDGLPSGTTYKWVEKPDTNTTPGSKPGKVLITYPDHSTEEVTVTVEVTPQKDDYDPQPKAQTVDNGHVPDPETSVTKTGLPEGTRVTWKDTPVVNTPGDHPSVALVTYPDGTVDEVTVPITVKEQKETFNPTAKEPAPTAKHGSDPSAEGSINTDGLPSGTTYKWVEKPDTNTTPGSKPGKVLITYPDKSTEEVTVTVEVTPQKDDYDPQPKAQTVDNGTVPKAEDSVAKTGLPEGTRVTWKDTPVVNTPGDHPSVALVTYPDGTVDEVTVPIAVKEQKDTFNPTAKEPAPTAKHGSDPSAEGSINTDGLPSGTTYTWVEKPDTNTTPGSKPGKVLITYPDHSTEEVSVTVEVTPQKDDYDPQPKAQTVDNGHVPDPETSVTKTGLPEGTRVTWKDTPVVNTPGDHPSVALVIYPDGTVDEVTVPITVKEQKETFNPTAKEPAPTAKHGSDPSAEGSINTDGLPSGTTYKWVEKPDTNTTPGSKPGKVLITYPDHSTEEVTVTVEVTPQKDDYDPQPKQQTVEHAQVPLAKDSIHNVKDLPEGSTFEWKDSKIPDTSKHGEKKGVVTVTYQDRSTEDVEVTITVNPKDFTPVVPKEKVPVKTPDNLTQAEQDKVKENVKKANPGKDVIVTSDGNVTITDSETNVTHNIPRDELLFAYAKGESEVLENPEFNGGVNGEPEVQPELPEFNGGVNGEPEVQPDLPEFNGGVNGELPDPVQLPKVQLIITKWVDEQGNELKPADAKAPSVPGEANEAFEHGEIEGYIFVRTETEGDVVTHVFKKMSSAGPIGAGLQGPATPSADTNRRPDTAIPAEVPATQPAEQPSQTVEVPAQLPNEVSETDSSVSQPQAVLPNTGTQEDRATGAFGVLSLLGAFGLLFAKKKKDDEEEA